MKKYTTECWTLIGGKHEEVIYVSKCDKFKEELQPEEIRDRK